MMSSADATLTDPQSVLHLMVSYKCAQGVSGQWWSIVCVCMCVREQERVLSGQ